ncbi:MAG: hypothetical protein P0Y56_03720 [Candidatus Andeanibacterium colombiense]|uniref:Uncharacterized protein n=1 Tax=Candidatus Andeanibacterium colombiense TaxID=3121345 RepID=A0AAJ5XA63_9SPHN|nr:MAG: hypothetical protein P0Y56_03720 [Sphingomonadaceae bacterium]
MNKFETSLLQTLSSIDESLKALAGRKTPALKPVAPKPVKAPAAKPAKPAKKVKKTANGALPKALAKAAAAVEKGAAS